jgi:hypothetical protein
MKIKAVYDNGGKTFDRYSVYYENVECIKDGKKMYTCFGMSEHPFHPQGFGQHSCGQLGKHNGKKISWSELPEDCKLASL